MSTIAFLNCIVFVIVVNPKRAAFSAKENDVLCEEVKKRPAIFEKNRQLKHAAWNEVAQIVTA